MKMGTDWPVMAMINLKFFGRDINPFWNPPYPRQVPRCGLR
jgi:hypothetical protein